MQKEAAGSHYSSVRCVFGRPNLDVITHISFRYFRHLRSARRGWTKIGRNAVSNGKSFRRLGIKYFVKVRTFIALHGAYNSIEGL